MTIGKVMFTAISVAARDFIFLNVVIVDDVIADVIGF